MKKLKPDESLAKIEKATDEKTPANHEKEVEEKEEKKSKKDAKTATTLEQLPGIGPTTAERLRSLGYTFVGLATARADEVAAEMGISFVLAKQWITQAQEAVLSKMVLKTGTQVAKERKANQYFFKTGSEGFNALIGGGFATMRTTGLAGRLATGKTQAAFDAVVDCLAKTKRKAVYIETEPDTFSESRLNEIASKRALKIDLDNLYVCENSQIPTAKAQYLQYKVVQKELEKGTDIGLVVVDSFTAKFRPGYSRREMLPVRTREFTEHFMLIDYLASKYNLAWILTCQVIGAPDPGQGLAIKMKTGDSFYPVGGEFLLHSVNTWVSMQQVKSELWEATLFDSSYLPRKSCNFVLSPKGLMDGVR